ncbi:hypothetical protein Fcan01_25663 [Folsomia candida]|uniref:Uncharacterized protein n=1 Tax=Folsomia candida TaxID=158441 RepID=A0A226D2L6_FOLCA|nr:hypothetical protein Fcan01_25663 [Folsomia candida]
MPSSISILLFAGTIFSTRATIEPSSNNPLAQGITLPITYYMQFKLANSLQLGESCSWRDETIRQAHYPPTDDCQARIFYRSNETLVCDKNTARCVCGEDHVQANLGTLYNSRKYVTEWDAWRERNVCRYGRGAPCVPSSFGGISGSPAYQCAKGLSCT